jgi:hypothetical protein
MSQEDLAAIPESNEGRHHEGKLVPMCPDCGCKRTRRSMRRSWRDRFKSVFGQFPYRCQMCNKRFTAPQDQEAIARHNAGIEEEMRLRNASELALDEETEQEPRDKQ